MGDEITPAIRPPQTIRRMMTARALVATCILGLSAMSCAPAAAASSGSQVRSVYRSVLEAEYFGPSAGVCDRLTARGRAAYTAGGGGTCPHAFAAEQRVLHHKIPGVDDSGYTPVQWRTVVDQVMANLRVSLSGSKASVVGPYGIPGRTQLTRVGGRWLFTTYPPSVGS